MSIPLYFAMHWDETAESGITQKAQLGFRFRRDGTLLLPQKLLADAPVILDDSSVPAALPDKDILQMLSKIGRNGIFLDFERPKSAWSIALLHMLNDALPQDIPLFVPESYANLLPRASVVVTVTQPPNHWSRFCKTQQEKYKRWGWEVVPCRQKLRLSQESFKSGTLEYAGCLCRQENGMLIYYDTMQTIRSKLEIAACYGCTCAIGLYSELKQI